MKKIVLLTIAMLAIASWSVVSQADPTWITYVCGLYNTVNNDEGHIINSRFGEKDWRISENVVVYLDGKKSSLEALEDKPLSMRIDFTIVPKDSIKDKYEAIVIKAVTISKEEAMIGIVQGEKSEMPWERN